MWDATASNSDWSKAFRQLARNFKALNCNQPSLVFAHNSFQHAPFLAICCNGVSAACIQPESSSKEQAGATIDPAIEKKLRNSGRTRQDRMHNIVKRSDGSFHLLTSTRMFANPMLDCNRAFAMGSNVDRRRLDRCRQSSRN
jgi:hypothetical protein